MWKAGAVLVTGTDRGLGIEMVKQLQNIEACNTIVACCLEPSSAQELNLLAEKSNKILVKTLNVTNEIDIQRLADELTRELPQGLNLLINNAGISLRIGDDQDINQIPSSIEGETSETLIHTYRVNTVGPFLVSKALLPLLLRGAKNQGDMSVIFNVSSRMGSIQENDLGGVYGYRMSKTALNMLTKNFAIDLADKGILCVACHPGWVSTNIGGPNARFDPPTSVAGMFNRIMELTPSDNGKLIRFDGAPIKY